MGKRVKRFLIPTGAGFVLAVVVWILTWAGFPDRDGVPQFLGVLWGIVHFPSVILLYVVILLQLPPHGDAGFIWLAILPGIQWILVGTAIGTIRAISTEGRKPGEFRTEPPSSPTPQDGE